MGGHGGVSTYLEVLQSSFHDNGQDCSGWALGPGHCHGIYLNGVANTLIEDSKFYKNEGFGIHLYSEPTMNDNMVVRRNLIYDNGFGGAAGVKPDTYGMILGSGTNILTYNNILWNNSGGGILINYGGTNINVSNNTIYSNGQGGPAGACILVGGAGVSGTIVRNNICYQNPAGIIDSSSPAAVVSNNLMTDPRFVDSTSGNFRLQSGSSAINAGVTMTMIMDDYSGASRPQGTAYDIGAYEY